MKIPSDRRRRLRRAALPMPAWLVALVLPGAPLAQEPPAAPQEPAAQEASSDDALEAELAEELAGIQAAQEPQQGSSPTTPSGATASSRGLSNTFNPAISAIGLGLVGWSSREEVNPAGQGRDDLETGITIQEVELRLSAIVDPYFRADLTLSANTEEIGFEEAYLSTLALPRVTIRGGQMYAAFGRHNELHTHAFPFVTTPLPWRELLGPEGLKDPGISADVLLPLPFFTELQLQVFNGEWRPLEGELPDDPATAVDESVPDARAREDFAYLAHLQTLFELSDSTTVELGGTYLGGRNGFDGWTHVIGADLTLKWRPIEAERYTSVDWSTETVWVDRENAPADARVGGAYTSLRYQFVQRWWLQGRGALLGLPAGGEGRTWRAEALAAFVPSEFSALRLQYAYETHEDADVDPIHEVFFQVVFSVGSHPAHAY